MLLFIEIFLYSLSPTSYFKTSHVIVYQRLRKYNRFICLISKHLMLLFIELRVFTVDGISKISKHLMLLFIRFIIHEIFDLIFISKHLMLLFISLAPKLNNIGGVFQNISCYCLSVAQLNGLSNPNYFKTSHVIVYPSHFRVFSFSPPLFPLIFSIFLHFLPANTLILDRPTYHPINLLIFQAFLDFSFFFRLVKIL